MKNIRILVFCIVISFVFSSAFSQGYHVRIGTIGNSITHGNSLADPLTQAFPVVLDEMLKGVYGDTCLVKNYGLTTTTMLKNGDVSYWDTQHLKDYLSYAPEICFLMLGTNDTKPQNWDVYREKFIGDYLSMMDTIKARNPSTRFILAYPPPAFEIKWGIRDSVILNGVIPAIDSIAKLEEVVIMDFYYPLLDSAHLFPDNIHPGVEGNVLMAEMLLDRIIKSDIIHKADTGQTFITSFSTNKNTIPLGGTAELSWTIINADSIFINGEPVEKEGGVIVSPAETTPYTLLAKGPIKNDTSTITLEVYVQELARLRLSPSLPRRDAGDTIFLQAFHYDQFGLRFTRNYKDITWSLEGSGILYGETDTSIFFVCERPDTSYLEVSYQGDISYSAKIITRPYPTGIAKNESPRDFNVYPNPVNEKITIKMGSQGGPVLISLFDLKGVLQLERGFPSVLSHDLIRLNISDLASGIYVMKISYNSGVYTEQLLVN